MKNLFYAVDPGKTQCAVAAFLDGELVGVWFTASDTIDVSDANRGAVAMEQPRAYPVSPVRENDLLDLTAAGMAVASRLARAGEKVRLIEPQAWKGQVPKPITKQRIEAKLSQGERMRMGECLKKPGGERHNLWDAVGIGLFALKRAGRGCI